MGLVKKIVCIGAFVMVSGVSAFAQSTSFDRLTPPLPTKNERLLADVASWGTVIGDIAIDTKASWNAPNRTHALELEASRLFVTWVVTAIAKGLVKRERPCAPSCGIDSPDSSFFSMHTAFAFSTVNNKPGLYLAVSTGGLRIAAGKHWLSDVLVGAGVGLLTREIR